MPSVVKKYLLGTSQHFSYIHLHQDGVFHRIVPTFCAMNLFTKTHMSGLEKKRGEGGIGRKKLASFAQMIRISHLNCSHES